jgi:hypothetical protein
MVARFVRVDRETQLLLPPDMREWVPKSRLGMDLGLRGLQSAPPSPPGDHQNTKNHSGMRVMGGKRPPPRPVQKKPAQTFRFGSLPRLCKLKK